MLRMATRARAGSQSGRGIEREGLPDLECGILNYLNSVSGQFGMAGLLKFHLPISFADFRSVEYQSDSISQAWPAPLIFH